MKASDIRDFTSEIQEKITALTNTVRADNAESEEEVKYTLVWRRITMQLLAAAASSLETSCLVYVDRDVRASLMFNRIVSDLKANGFTLKGLTHSEVAAQWSLHVSWETTGESK